MTIQVPVADAKARNGTGSFSDTRRCVQQALLLEDNNCWPCIQFLSEISLTICFARCYCHAFQHRAARSTFSTPAQLCSRQEVVRSSLLRKRHDEHLLEDSSNTTVVQEVDQRPAHDNEHAPISTGKARRDHKPGPPGSHAAPQVIGLLAACAGYTSLPHGAY